MSLLADNIEVELGNAACAVISVALAEAKKAGNPSEATVLAILTEALALGLVLAASPCAHPERLADAALEAGPILSKRVSVLGPLVALLATPHVGEA